MVKNKGIGILFLLLIAITTVLFPRLELEEVKPHSTENSSRYGEPLPWSQVRLLFPRYTVAVVEDLETGKRFEVERRGGTYHADVQPISARDTAVMQEIFSQGWTWQRRAIVVEAGLQRIAASMNGMPHGSGKIGGNNFKGHFCLHFLGSRVHKSSRVDPAHQLMIWKAAGEPLTPFLQAEPREVIELVATAINQKDGELAALGIKAANNEDVWLVNQALLAILPQLEIVSIKEEPGQAEEQQDLVTYHLQVKLLFPGQLTKEIRQGLLKVKREASCGRWLADGADLRDLVAQD